MLSSCPILFFENYNVPHKLDNRNCVKPAFWTVKKYETQTVDNGIVGATKTVPRK